MSSPVSTPPSTYQQSAFLSVVFYFRPPFHISVVSLTVTREGKNLTGTRLGKHLTGTKGRKQLPVVFCFPDISDTSIFLFSLSPSVSTQSPTLPHSSSLCRLQFQPHLPYIPFQPFSVAFCFTPISDTSTFVFSLSPSVSTQSPTLLHSSSLCRLQFQPHLPYIPFQPFSVAFCFTPISDTSTFVFSLSSSVSPPFPTYPH